MGRALANSGAQVKNFFGDTSMGGPAAQFPTTRWTQVVRLHDPESREFKEAVNHLARSYWKPVYAYIRSGWRKTNEEAKDLTQEFFTFLMESKALRLVNRKEGKFRLLLMTVLKHFLVDEHRRSGRIKRGGSTTVVPIDDAALPVDDPKAKSPEEAFDRAWARELLGKALRELEERLTTRGRRHQFVAFRLRYVELFGQAEERSDDEESLKEMARQAHRSLSEFKNDLVAAREAFREVVLDSLRESVDSEQEAQEELQYLLEVL